ncbi:MAG: FAD-binding protein [Cyclobacteriaceae bacterium]|nr:FAD-binding protein [Cyclobacteriaceae bacterium]
MKKRTFLKLSTAALTGAALSPILSCTSGLKTDSEIKNWAGNLTYHAKYLLEPATVGEVQHALANHASVRVLGTRHCFNTIADTEATLLSTAKLNKIIAIDRANMTVTVEGGIRYGEFCKEIHAAGFAIHNLASLPHISVAGACATATHGSGVYNGNLATQVVALELVTATGEVLNISRASNADLFDAAVVSLGSFGVVTKVTMDLVPAFEVRQDVFLNLPMEQLQANFVELMSGGYSVSLFTDWQSDAINQVWVKSVVNPDVPFEIGDNYYGASRADRNVHPIIALSAEHCTEQMGIPGPWYERLPHFKMGFTPSSGEELQAEYFVPLASAVDAIEAVATLREEIKPYILITEIRSIAADAFWMSPCYQQASVAIHFTLKQDIAGVNAILPKIEATLAPFQAKPHWGKLFTLDAATLRARYPRIEDFKNQVVKLDPDKKLRNEFIDHYIFG